MNWNTHKSKKFIDAVLLLETRNQAQKFLRDIMTQKEIDEFSTRFQAADMLTQGFSYKAIIAKTGLSSTTVARVSKWLNGSEGGYRFILHKLHKHQRSSGLELS